MFSGLKNSLENLARKSRGKVPLDKEITDFLHEKHRDSFGLNELIDAHMRIREYMDDLELRKDLLEKKTVLDIGSNGHFFDEYCKEKYQSMVVALDHWDESLGDKHPYGVVGDAKNLPFKDGSFDLVISHASMPHLFVTGTDEESKYVPIEGNAALQSKQDISSLFREVYRVLKVGGQIRMSTFSEREYDHLIKAAHKNGF